MSIAHGWRRHPRRSCHHQVRFGREKCLGGVHHGHNLGRGNPAPLGKQGIAQLPEILTSKFGHELPKPLVEADRNGTWPQGRIPGPRFSGAPFLKEKKIDVELESSIDRIRLDDSPIATLGTLVSAYGIDAGLFNLDKDNALVHPNAIYKVLFGSTRGQVPDLPYLDTAEAICIGGGADYGDDTWLLLDYRTDANDPRVIGNHWVYVPDGPGRSLLVDFRWVEIAPSLSEFLRAARS
jgi:hypothetical protein